MTVFEQRSGGHAAYRVQPEPGSDEEKRLSELAEAGKESWVRVEEAEPEGDDEANRPTRADNKAAWVDWAVANDADRAEAEAMTKDDLIKAYGG